MTGNSQKFLQAMQAEKPLQLVGAVNAFTAIMAKDAGFQAIYLSGAGVANISYGLPDVGITTLDHVLEDAARILNAVDIPLIVDIDTGFGNELNIKRAIRTLNQLGVAGVHIEDQVFDKRCGHLDDKKLVSSEEMCLRIKAAVSAKIDEEFIIIARTDALSVEGMDQTIQRAIQYKKAGADMIFLEAASDLKQYALFKKAIDLPLLANMTEFGKTPLFELQELRQAGVDIVLYPLSASRAMNKAALNTYRDIRQNGTAKKSVPSMQTRDELYRLLDYKVNNE